MQRFALILSAVGGIGIVAVLILLAVQSPSRRVLARAGEETLTAAEFQRMAKEAGLRYALPPDSAKLALAQDWLRRALMLESARTNPALLDSMVRQYRAQTEHQVLIQALSQQLLPSNVPVSEAEVRRFWESRGQESHVQVVYALDRRMMRAGLAALEGGESFDSVADRFSIPGLLPPRGDLGWVTPGALVNPLDHAVQTTPIGQVAGPFEAPGEGWFLIKVLERRPREQAPYEQEAPQLKQMLAQRKQRTAAARAFRMLRAQYDIRTRDEGVSALYQQLNTPPLIQDFGGISAPPPPTPEERATVLGSWDGGPGHAGIFTLGEAIDDLEAGRGERPNASMSPALEMWVSNRILEKVAEIEARRRRLHEQPDVADQIRAMVNDYILQGAIDADITRMAQPTPEDLEAEYQQNLAQLATLRAVTVQHLTLPDSVSALRAFDQVRTHRTLKDAVLLASAGMQVQEEQVRYPTQDPTWLELENAFLQAPLGTYLPPVRLPSGSWRVVQLTAREMPTPPMSELPAQMQQALYQRAMERAQQRRLNAFTDSLRTVIRWSLDRDAIRREPWPMAGFMQGG